MKQTDADVALRTATSDARQAPVPITDPRNGDLEDDALSPKQRSLLSIAGSLFAEIHLPKLLSAWFLSIGALAGWAYWCFSLAWPSSAGSAGGRSSVSPSTISGR